MVSSRPLAALVLARCLSAGGIALLMGIAAAYGAAMDVSAFVGTWTFRSGSNSSIACAEIPALTTQLGGTPAGIYPGTTSDLVFEIGCHCRMAMNVDGPNLVLAGPQSCRLVNRGVATWGTVQTLTLTRDPDSPDGALGFNLQGNDAAVAIGGGQACSAGTFSGTGALTRTDLVPVTCGDEATAVGVIPYSPNGTVDCQLGGGRAGLQIRMHDEDEPACSDQTGSRGEGAWVLPDDTRERRPFCDNAVRFTTLHFCRVDGARFAPLTTSADPDQYFALLKLGDRCPAGAIEVTKTIDNEDSPISQYSRVIGEPGPNTVLAEPPVGTVTSLQFCYFRAAAQNSETDSPTMAAFPDLGFPYAVFHRHGGEQPPWVITKRWLFSNDEDRVSIQNPYQGTDPDIVDEFKLVIENPQGNTYFNMARVR